MGDRAIHGGHLGMGGLHFEAVDANSKPTAQHSEQRTVDGKSVFLTPDDAAKLDRLKADGDPGQFSVAVKGTTVERLKAAFDELLGR